MEPSGSRPALDTVRNGRIRRKVTQTALGPRRASNEARRVVCVYGRMRQSASRRTQLACATAARVACVSLSGLSIMKSWVMPS
jgi:hypothetical protein